MKNVEQDQLVPVVGCCVVDRVKRSLEGVCQVVSIQRRDEQTLIAIRSKHQPTPVTRLLGQLGSGFRAGMYVAEAPTPGTSSTRGEGIAMSTRSIAGREQVLVMFTQRGELSWVPYQRLRMLERPSTRYVRGSHKRGDGERLRLRALANCLMHWNENTGALSRLEVDPLPHQLHLVHHILRSGSLDWLIADDVGLGKTIEVGMLLSALSHRRDFERVLIVTPAGLTTQWQEELSVKFGMDDYLVHGRHFSVEKPSQWRLFPHVIASVDSLKREENLLSILNAPRWDLVIFDEAHWLSRLEHGTKYSSSQRFKLAAALRPHAEHMLLLTATPHQGKPDKFRALLELLRPEWKERFDTLNTDPSFLREMIYRNRKSEVTDSEGNFIFHGQDTHALELELSDEELEFDAKLQEYFEHGYDMAAKGDDKARAIGFVMTTFRKLAASSHLAIVTSLKRRLAKLMGEANTMLEEVIAMEEDARFGGEYIERQLDAYGAGTFFDDEVDLLSELIELGSALLDEDSKLARFIDVIEKITAEDAGRRVLIFTEFRTTQRHVEAALAERFGADRVGLIHGGLKLDEKREVVSRFADTLQFVVSTEAGGEGLNMHHGCHTMINYDLPWNPMRLVQRMGRLYRYGQKERVVVFNLHSPQTLDGKVVDLLYRRIQQVVQDLATLGEEFHEGLHLEIFGELATLAEVEGILDAACENNIERTEAQIEDALRRAKESHDLQQRLLDHAQGFDADALAGQLSLEHAHLDAFIKGMLAQLGCPIIEKQYEGRVWRVRLTDALRDALETKAQSLRITTHRELAAHDIRVMDFDEPLFCHLIDVARSEAFGGVSASARGSEVLSEDGALGFVRVCWQNGAGVLMREEIVATSLKEGGKIEVNSPEAAAWLLRPVADREDPFDVEARKKIAARFLEHAEDYLGQGSNAHLHPMLAQHLAMASLTKV